MAEKNYTGSNTLSHFLAKLKILFQAKVDKIEGKGLSTNDYTTEEKIKLSTLENYELPTASSTIKGGFKVGAGLQMNGEILSATGGGTADSVDWSNVQNKPTKVSEFSNDSGYITNSDLEGYATENFVTQKGYQTAAEVNTAITNKGYQTAGDVSTLIANAIKDIQGISYSIVTSLPATGEAGVIYLISNSGANPNAYDEYIWITDKFEKIGTTEVDLTGYLKQTDLVEITNDEVDAMMADW